jgi:hypothetical protein
MEFNLYRLPHERSKIARGEIFLFPLLREVWKEYADDLSLFSHEPFAFDDDLCGVPDYFVCRPSDYGPTIPDVPYLVVIETDRDDFRKGWGQCLAAMLAAQKLRDAADKPTYGIVANGTIWEFGVLLGNEFTCDQLSRAITPLETFGQALHAVFRACQDLAMIHVPATTRA